MKRLLVKVDSESLRPVKANGDDYYFHLGGSGESQVELHSKKMQKMSGEILPIRVAPRINYSPLKDKILLEAFLFPPKGKRGIYEILSSFYCLFEVVPKGIKDFLCNYFAKEKKNNNKHRP